MVLALLLAGAGIVRAETGLLNATEFTDPLQIPGRLEANGTHFELTNSSYLNITLDSSEPINLVLESVPEMVTMYVGSLSGAASVHITLGGFLPLTTYHKYEDDYHNHTNFTTDAGGDYTYTQDLSKVHVVFIQPRSSTKFIRDDATGGDCASFGTWNAATKTCTLTTDLTETIQIDSSNVTLDGNGHTITGSNPPTGSGVFLPVITGVTVKNLTVENFEYGIHLISSSNNKIISNNVRNNVYCCTYGILLIPPDFFWKFTGWIPPMNNTITNNTVNSNIFGIRLINSHKNTLINNTASYDGKGITLEGSNNNILIGNTATNSYWLSGIWIGGIGGSHNNILISNNASNNNVGWGGIVIDNYGNYNNTLLNNTINSNNNGIVLLQGSNNIITSNTVTTNIYGIFLYGFESGGNTIYNNYFNNRFRDVYDGAWGYGLPRAINIWNITRTAGTNIMGGPYLGGNFWANPSGTGFSQICADADNDGICDSSYTLNSDIDGSNIDYLPLTYRRDNIPPTTTISLTGTLGSNGWYISNVTVNLTAADNTGGSEVKKIEYSFDNITWTTYITQFNISVEGTTIIYYRSIDNANNVESTKNQTIKIDKTLPIITINTPVPYGVYPISTALDFSASDSLSGLTTTVSGNLPNTTGAYMEVASGFTPPPGVYTLIVSATDRAGNTATSNPVYFVVYDPNGGYVTGAGWIDSPAGAYTANSALTGQANFGFVSRYQNGATTPTGVTEFQFRVANLKFYSNTYEWLVVAGARAQYKGTGMINGTGSYGFMLTAIDGAINGGGGSDKFRIKIWDKNNNDAVVYDNQLGAEDSAEPTTVVQGGSIIIHTEK